MRPTPSRWLCSSACSSVAGQSPWRSSRGRWSTAGTRIYLGVHYPFDVLVGILFGSLVGLTVYRLYFRLYLRISPKLHYISTQYTRTGYSLCDIDVFLTVMVCTCIYVLLRTFVTITV